LNFENVSFNYSDSKPALRGINFQVVAGESIAVIGPSGAGKTTLLNLLPRFYDPHGGAVLLEGVDLRQLRVKDLRAQIALVLQEPIILPATIAENISYGRPDARQSEIEAAARAANAEEFICRLPLHYKTRVGEAGARLSVGEMQRLSLARAFLKNAPLLLMDEPTSALDVESETQVAASFFGLMRGRTTLMVAHRLSTIRRVNKILVIEDGQVSEFGTPEALLARRCGLLRARHRRPIGITGVLVDGFGISRPAGTGCVSCQVPAFENAGYYHRVPVGPNRCRAGGRAGALHDASRGAERA
jgi:ABC-type multidrug transport system fused ATPase/permease subunit